MAGDGEQGRRSPEEPKAWAGSSTILIVPEKMQGKADAVANIVCRIVTVKPGVYHEIDGLEIEMVSALLLLCLSAGYIRWMQRRQRC